jgi:hypothetical protein
MSLSSEQQYALDELMKLVPVSPADHLPQQPDFLKTWLGMSASDVRTTMKAMGIFKDGAEQKFLDWVEANPLDANFELISAASFIFYLAEKDENPRIKTYMDAFYYISTCASVGYADIFAATQTGRAIAGLIMTIGPALTGKALDRPKPIRS